VDGRMLRSKLERRPGCSSFTSFLISFEQYMLTRRTALWFREPNVSRENCRSKESKSKTVRIYIKASIRIVISMYLPPSRAPTNEVICKMRSRNVVTGHFQSNQPRTC
jgi:hypothetical protein